MRYAIIGSTFLALTAKTLAATLNVELSTDRPIYAVGEAVHWQVRIGSDADLALLGVDITETSPGLGEALQTATLGPSFTFENGFLLTGTGVADAPGSPDGVSVLADVYAAQFLSPTSVPELANQALFAAGQFLVTAEGTHQLMLNVGSANYWSGESAFAYETVNASPAISFQVVPEPAAMGMIVCTGVILRRRRTPPPTRGPA